MPQIEDDVKDADVSEPPSKITALWNKFHFSGRVIMCSVLFGLGLVLIGGLIYAINMDDETKKNDKDDLIEELPTKAPSNYVGPIVMGIGGFIVIVGVVMCLFETQVCRKKTGDAKPLISDKNEVSEIKVSDSAAVPSSSHCHKNHKHKSRKAASSPRKTKIKNAKSQSRDEKLASSKSPPISIDQSKSFMTSSEENFLTPPNEHPAVKQSNSREAEIQTSSSLMQSFTSSGPSWNQSTEFLTPAASFNGNSLSLDNSVELDEKQGQVNFKTNEARGIEPALTEFMTPVMTEEEKIQKMFTQVKNEHMKIGKEQSEEKSSEQLGFERGNDINVINAENVYKIAQNVQTSKNDMSLGVNFDYSAVAKSTDELPPLDNKSKIDNKVNTCSNDVSNVSDVLPEKMLNKNESKVVSSGITGKENVIKKEIQSSHEYADIVKSEDGNALTEEKEKLDSKDTEKLDSITEGSTSHVNEATNIQQYDLESSNEKNNENDMEVDQESNASSEETLISRDSSIEKTKNNDIQTELSITEENSSDKYKSPDDSESLKKEHFLSNHGISTHRDSLSDISKAEKFVSSDFNDKENPLKETKDVVETLTVKPS